ncbi:MAG: hypothetical protein JSV86_00365 [Gemmatimonadota bacterium]|nr:MAG: hypothetical protein JSV86_00365 [Gemmatimonadota bacterium]
MATKSSTLCIASRSPGRCTTCRHANQDTVDFTEGRICCGWDGKPKAADQTCDVAVQIPRDVGGKGTDRYFVFEPYDGGNGTWGKLEDTRILAEDASPELRHALQADTPYIPPE